MEKAKVIARAKSALDVALQLVKVTVGWLALVAGVIFVIYLVRLPFYDERLIDYLPHLMAAVWFLVAVFVLGAIWALIAFYPPALYFVLAVLVIAGISHCSGSRTCAESRYIVC